MKRLLIHLIVILLTAFFIVRSILPSKETEGFNLDAFAELPLKYEGRKKPIDTLARNFLTILSGKQSVRQEDGSKISATEWFLDNIANKPGAVDYKVFRVTNHEVLSTLGLEGHKPFRYSYREILPGLTKLDAAYRAAAGKQESARDSYDRKVLKLSSKVFLYQNMMATFEDPSGIPAEQLQLVMQRYNYLESGASIPLIIPPHSENPRWKPLMSALLTNHPGLGSAADHAHIQPDLFATQLAVILAAYRSGDDKLFNSELAEYRTLLETKAPESLNKISFEILYNKLSAFMKSAQLYLLVFILGCFGWMARKKILQSIALTLMVCAFIPHTFALIARCFLSGYPPVTNLYSTAIFIGWGAVLAGIILESGFRKRSAGIGTLVGGIAGFATLLVAHFLAGDGDTLEQMRAVLDTRFWLTTHVITIVLGYMATFIAGTIGVFYILAGLLSKRIDEETGKNMYSMMFGTVCFAMLFSFTGTVLGGLWADDSWGRFWGWDPKENGALLIVLWNAIILHARIGKMIGQRGFAVMVVLGNIVTSWSWFGVNQLGVGLHSYGFTDSAGLWLPLFALSQLLIALAGTLPTKLWRSSCKR